MKKVRRQLTLFVEDADAIEIEVVRSKFDPVQRALINSHVTLCREDELQEMERVIENLENLDQSSISLQFGAPVRVDNGKGVWLPSIGSDIGFYNLRKAVLKGPSEDLMQYGPHITLMHSRNSTCTGLIFNAIAKVEFPALLSFSKIFLIEQIGDRQWEVLKTTELNTPKK